MTQFAKCAAIGFKAAIGLTPCANDCVVSFIFRDGDGLVHDISNLSKKCLSLRHDVLCLLLLLIDLFLKGFGLSLLSRNIGLFVSLFLGTSGLVDEALFHP